MWFHCRKDSFIVTGWLDALKSAMNIESEHVIEWYFIMHNMKKMSAAPTLARNTTNLCLTYCLHHMFSNIQILSVSTHHLHTTFTAYMNLLKTWFVDVPLTKTLYNKAKISVLFNPLQDFLESLCSLVELRICQKIMRADFIDRRVYVLNQWSSVSQGSSDQARDMKKRDNFPDGRLPLLFKSG